MNIKKYVINLDRRPDRLKEFYDRYGSREVEVFSAVDGKAIYESGDLSDEDVSFIYSNLIPRLKNLPGVLGCWVSHIKLWKSLLSSSEDAYLIFEDDAFFSEGYEDKLNFVLNQINENVDLFYIGGRPRKNFTPHSIVSNWDEIDIDDGFPVYKQINFSHGPDFSRTTHAYIITRHGAEKILSILKDSKDLPAIDDWMTEIRSRINCFEVFPHLCWSPFDYQTDIQRITATLKTPD